MEEGNQCIVSKNKKGSAFSTFCFYSKDHWLKSVKTSQNTGINFLRNNILI